MPSGGPYRHPEDHMTVTRRQLLGTGAAAGMGLAIGGTLAPAGAASAASAPGSGWSGGRRARPFPPLVDDPAGLLALPEGFSYTIVSRAGETLLDDGAGPTPGRQDGTGVFRGPGGRGLSIISNHEIGPYSSPFTVPPVPGTVYDPGAIPGGGVTIVSTDRSGRRRGERVGLSGTVSNCAGGVTPWGSWLSCEETEKKPGDTWSAGGTTGAYEKFHGYVFEIEDVPAPEQLPLPIKAWGRFAHEAVVIEPSRRRVYLTEDASKPNGLFYRWTAPSGVRLRPRIAATLSDDAGVLEAMKVVLADGSVLPDLAYLTSGQLGQPFRVEWTTVPDRAATTTSTRKQLTPGVDVTASKKLEGAWGTEHGVYFASSYAFAPGDLPVDAVAHDGQIWFYDYRQETLTLVNYFPHLPDETPAAKYPDLYFDGPDNVHVTPWGGLILAEDGIGASHVLSTTPLGATYAIGRNQILIDGEYSEFTGPCFSPDGNLLFVNIQEPGITFAVHGPWRRYLA